MLLMFLAALLFLVALWATFFVVYQLVLAFLYFAVKGKVPEVSEPRKKFGIIIPAHDEEEMIGVTLDSWTQVDYPKNLFDVYIIADNCTDNTAVIARAHGSACLERQDKEKRGKGYALAWALKTIRLNAYDAIIIVDADTTVSSNFLKVMNDRLIGGDKIIQGYDGVLNPDETTMTRLIQITNVMKNLLFNDAKSKVGLSVQLMGTGMCFERGILQEIGWTAFSIGEDGEQFAYLAEAGIHVKYDPRAVSYAHEASSLGQAYTQRMRWVSGRMQLFGSGVRLFLKGLWRFDFKLMDAALTFLIPAYVELANATILGILLLLWVNIPAHNFLLTWFFILLAGQIVYFFIGVFLSQPNFKTFLSIGFAPIFLVWRGMVNLIAIFYLKQSAWVRTQRVPDKNNQKTP